MRNFIRAHPHSFSAIEHLYVVYMHNHISYIFFFIWIWFRVKKNLNDLQLFKFNKCKLTMYRRVWFNESIFFLNYCCCVYLVVLDPLRAHPQLFFCVSNCEQPTKQKMVKLYLSLSARETINYNMKYSSVLCTNAMAKLRKY